MAWEILQTFSKMNKKGLQLKSLLLYLLIAAIFFGSSYLKSRFYWYKPYSIIFEIAFLIVIIFGFSRISSSPSNNYKRLENWITRRIGRIDKKMPEHKVKDKLRTLYEDEERKFNNPKRLSGFKSYIDSSRYKNLLR
jgi:hypothetical protein